MSESAQLLLAIFSTDILPIFVLATVGFLLARYAGADARTLSRVTFNALGPSLVFHLLVTSTVSRADFGRMALFCVLLTAATGVIARIAATPFALTRPELSAFLLVVMFSNGGNYGLPVTLFAFGTDALTFATVYFVTASLLTYTVGVFLAAAGQQTARQALIGITKVPVIYAVLAAGLVRLTGVSVPLAVMRPIELLSQASLPVMILVLGTQIERARRPERPLLVVTAVLVSLFVTPVLAYGVAHALGLSGAAFQAAIVQSSMPAAVVTTILALQYEIAPSFVTSVVFASTLASPFTVTVLIAWLKGM